LIKQQNDYNIYKCNIYKFKTLLVLTFYKINIVEKNHIWQVLQVRDNVSRVFHSTCNFYFRAKSFIEIQWWHYADTIVLYRDASTFPSSLPRLMPNSSYRCEKSEGADNISVFSPPWFSPKRDVKNFYKIWDVSSSSFVASCCMFRVFYLSPRIMHLFIRTRPFVECDAIKNKIIIKNKYIF